MLDHRTPNTEWQPKPSCKCPRCLYYWAGFERGLRMKNISYKGFLISYLVYPIDNRYSAESLIDNGVVRKWIYPDRDSLQQSEIKEHIVQLSKDWIDNHIENSQDFNSSCVS